MRSSLPSVTAQNQTVYSSRPSSSIEALVSRPTSLYWLLRWLQQSLLWCAKLSNQSKCVFKYREASGYVVLLLLFYLATWGQLILPIVLKMQSCKIWLRVVTWPLILAENLHWSWMKLTLESQFFLKKITYLILQTRHFTHHGFQRVRHKHSHHGSKWPSFGKITTETHIWLLVKDSRLVSLHAIKRHLIWEHHLSLCLSRPSKSKGSFQHIIGREDHWHHK